MMEKFYATEYFGDKDANMGTVPGFCEWLSDGVNEVSGKYYLVDVTGVKIEDSALPAALITQMREDGKDKRMSVKGNGDLARVMEIPAIGLPLKRRVLGGRN